MTQQDQKLDQISSYREEQKLKYEKKKREEYIRDKYQQFAEYDPIKRAARIITNAMKKHLLPTPINLDTLATIPGQFRFKLQVTELNTYPLEIQKDIFNNITKGYDHTTSKTLLQSLKESYVSLYWIVIDLRIYGPCPEISIYLTELDQMLYLTEDQINKIKSIWINLDPETVNGIRFQQMLDSSKTLAVLYKLSKELN